MNMEELQIRDIIDNFDDNELVLNGGLQVSPRSADSGERYTSRLEIINSEMQRRRDSMPDNVADASRKLLRVRQDAFNVRFQETLVNFKYNMGVLEA